MRPIILAFLVACLSAAAPAFAQEAAPPTLDEVGLTWKKAPRIYDMARHYPVRAKAKGFRRGLAVVDCTPRANGRLDCVVVKEDPQEVFFGEAALNVMRPVTVATMDGGSPEGRTFRFTFKFGAWPQSALPAWARLDQFGLAWVNTPPIGKYWSGTGLDDNEVFSVALDCVADTEGRPACTVADDSAADANYVQAVLKAMDKAKVKTLDGSSPEGKTFTHRFTMGLD